MKIQINAGVSKNMKVGILTYHFSINCGAVLQCYALQEYYASKGIPVEVINYITPKQQDNIELYRKRLKTKNIIKNVLLIPLHFKRRDRLQRFISFQQQYLKCSRRVKNQDELRELIKEDGITHIIVGSDQVWNPRIDDFDSAFFLDFDTNAHKIGFSISLGYAKLADLLPYKCWIDQFENFSMREKSGKQIIMELNKQDAPITVDPTLLLDGNFWEKLVVNKVDGIREKEYVICYFLNKRHYKDNFHYASCFAKKKGLSIYTIDYAIHKDVFGHNSLKNLGPLEFISAIHNSKYVFTDSFHGTVFSLLFKKQFISINNSEMNSDTRRMELLSIYNKEELYRTIYENCDHIDLIKTPPEAICPGGSYKNIKQLFLFSTAYRYLRGYLLP